MKSTKEKMSEIIKSQPDDASYEEIIRELVFDLMVERGLEDSRKGNTISNDDMKNLIRSWKK